MDRVPLCENCGIAIRWQPTIVDGKVYCCPGCSQGGPCGCDYDNLPRVERTTVMIVRQAQDLRVVESG